jgi:hypothetical protein
MNRTFPQYTIPELEVVARIDHALADEVFILHRQGYDVREVLHEARAFKAEAQMMRREINRRKKSNSQGVDHEH